MRLICGLFKTRVESGPRRSLKDILNVHARVCIEITARSSHLSKPSNTVGFFPKP